MRKKIIGIMKKISCIDFLLKKRRENSVIFCGVIFHEDSFRDIVREKKNYQRKIDQ
jgi:predicted aldo/keto reductase-like oxidoreductase